MQTLSKCKFRTCTHSTINERIYNLRNIRSNRYDLRLVNVIIVLHISPSDIMEVQSPLSPIFPTEDTIFSQDHYVFWPTRAQLKSKPWIAKSTEVSESRPQDASNSVVQQQLNTRQVNRAYNKNWGMVTILYSHVCRANRQTDG